MKSAKAEARAAHEVPSEGEASVRLEALANALAVLDIGIASTGQNDSARDHGCHAYIPYDPLSFLSKIHLARSLLSAQSKKGPTRFLDVGSGTGTKVFLASRYFDQADGIEYDAGYFALSRSVGRPIMRNVCKFYPRDALDFDHYDQYDVVYLYRPFRERRMQSRLERVIASAIKSGTILIAPLCRFDLRASEFGLRKLAPDLFIKGVSRREGIKLLVLASQVDLSAEFRKNERQHRLQVRLQDRILASARGRPVVLAVDGNQSKVLPRSVFNAWMDRLARADASAADVTRLSLGLNMTAPQIAALTNQEVGPVIQKRQHGLNWLKKQLSKSPA